VIAGFQRNLCEQSACGKLKVEHGFIEGFFTGIPRGDQLRMINERDNKQFNLRREVRMVKRETAQSMS